jgi:hypothetical protein
MKQGRKPPTGRLNRSRLRALAVIAALGAAALSLPMQPAVRAQVPAVVTPAIQVNRDITPNRTHFGQQLVVDPRDERTLVIIDNDLTTNRGNCPVFVSRDAGRTWATRTAQPKPESYGSCTRVTFGASLDTAFGADGTLYVLAAGTDVAASTGTTDVYMARSKDLGESWEFTTVVKGTDPIEFTKADGSKVSDTVRYNRIRMAVHPTDPDLVYAGIMAGPATRSGEAPLRANISVSTDGGRTFGPPVDIFKDVPHDQIWGADVPAVAVDRDGAIYAFTKERPPAPPATAAAQPATPSAPGDTPAPTTTTTQPPATGAGCPPQPARAAPLTPPTTVRVPDSAPALGKAGAGERLLFSKSTDNGRTWEGRAIDDSTAICRGCITTPDAAVDPKTGAVYVVFEHSDAGPPTPGEDRNIFFMASSDGGRTFSERVQLNDDVDPARKPNYTQLLPAVNVAPNGRVDVAWYDHRTDALFNPDGRGFSDRSGEICWDAFYTFSTDGGSTWAPDNVRVSDRSMNRDEGHTMNPRYDARAPMGLASTESAAYITWPDSRAGHPVMPVNDVYFAAVLHDTVAVDDDDGVERSSVMLGGAIGLVGTGLVLFVLSMLSRRRRAAVG